MIALALLAAAASTTDAYLDQTRARWEGMSRQLWEYAETGLKEDRSAAAIEELLQKEGFKVERNVAGMPTAFIATAGSGAPVVAIMAEYDALPGLSQKPGEAKKDPEKEGAPGHACGHNLLGTSAVAAGVAANRARLEQKLPGTIQIFGTPAEELLLGKVFMLKAGAFDKTDVVLSWHPESANQVVTRGTRRAPTRWSRGRGSRSPPPRSSSSGRLRTRLPRPGSGAARWTRWSCSTWRWR